MAKNGNGRRGIVRQVTDLAQNYLKLSDWPDIITSVTHWRQLLVVVVLAVGAVLTVVVRQTGLNNLWVLLGVLVVVALTVCVTAYVIIYLESRPSRERKRRGQDAGSPAQLVRLMPTGTVLFYIAPTLRYNDYYARLLTALQTELSKLSKDPETAVPLQYCSPLGDTPEDTYRCLEDLLKHVRPSDLIVMVPKGLHDPKTGARFRALVDKHSSTRIMFLDQPPPEDFRRNKERFSFVGVDNRKVGILAAFALHKALAQREDKDKEYKYCIVKGPGGDTRYKAFLAAVGFFDKKAPVDTLNVGDVDRIDSFPHINAYIKDQSPATPIGIFGGNDETSIAVLQALRDAEVETAFVVGCDSTREMRLIVDNREQPAAVATIDTRIRDQAMMTVRAIQSPIFELLEPKLHPTFLDGEFKKLLEGDVFKAFWDETT